MLQNLAFSVSVSVPIFIVMLIGWFLIKRRILDEAFFARANILIYYVALPAKLFSDMAGSNLEEAFDPGYLLFSIAACTVMFVLAWILGALMNKDPAKMGAFAHGAFRGNFVYVGFALLQNITGSSSIPAAAPAAAAVVLPLYNIYAVILLTVTNHPGSKIDFKSIFTGIIKNPMILAILLGLPFSIFQIELPFIITQPLNYLGELATPMALLMIGATIRMASIKKNWRSIVTASLFKLVFQPLLVVPLAVLAGFSHEQILVLYVLFAVPSAANVYIVTKTMGGDAEMASGIIIVSTLLSILTLTGGIFVLKSANML